MLDEGEKALWVHVLARSDAWVFCDPFQAPPADFWTPNR
jgi:hypothetical protein